MKVRTHAFTVCSEVAALPLVDILQQVEARSGDDRPGYNLRQVYIDSTTHPDYYAGLVLTIRDQSKFMKLQKERGHLLISVENLTGDEKLMEVNAFVLNKNSWAGLYQHYHHSCSLTQLGRCFYEDFKQLRDNAKALDIAENVPDLEARGAKKLIKAINRKYRGRFILAPRLSNETLEAELAKFSKIKAFTFEYSADDVAQRRGLLMDGMLRRRYERVVFKLDETRYNLARGILDAVTRLTPQGGRVQVESAAGETLSIDLFNIAEYYDEQDFDELVLKINKMDVATFANSPLITDLLAIAGSEGNRAIFETEVAS